MMKKIILVSILIALLVAAMALAQASDQSTSSATPSAHAAPTPSTVTITREPAFVPVLTQAAVRTPSPFATEPAGNG